MLRLLQRLVASPRLMRALGALSGSINPWHLDVRRDPCPAYRRLRAQARLARLETEAALGGLLRRFPDFQGPPRPRGWKASVVRRGPTALSLRLG